MRPVPQEPCLSLVHGFEKGPGGGFAARRYQDPAGFWTIAWGHKLTGPDDPLWDALIGTQAEADTLALADLTVAAQGVCDALGPAVTPLTDNQYAALIDFTFNEGVGRFAGSTLCHFLKIGAYAAVPAEFAKWVYGRVGGLEAKLEGLVRRRSAEVRVWLS